MARARFIMVSNAKVFTKELTCQSSNVLDTNTKTNGFVVLYVVWINRELGVE